MSYGTYTPLDPPQPCATAGCGKAAERYYHKRPYCWLHATRQEEYDREVSAYYAAHPNARD